MKRQSYKMLDCSILFFVTAFFIIMHPIGNIYAQQPTSITIGKRFYNSQEIFPFVKIKNIYRLAVSGSIQLYEDNSLIRLILVGDDFHEYLVYEAYPLLVDNSYETIINECEETCITEGIKPHSLKIELIDAFLQIDEIILADYSPSLAMMPAKAMKQIKEEQDAGKIKKLNENIKKKVLKWIAGETSVSKLFYEEKKKLFGNDKVPNLQGAEFYKGGIFEIKPEVDSSPMNDENGSSLIETFDWRKRHGADNPGSPYYDGDSTGSGWVTSVKDQGPYPNCSAFSGVGATEALTNLFFNQHLDLDLSEQDVVSCEGADELINYFITTGVVDEACFPYSGIQEPCENKCSNPNELIQLSARVDFQEPKTEEKLKWMIIDYGPLNGGIYSWNHAMTLVGYDKDYHDGQTIWIFKNSWGTWWGENGYGYIKTDINDIGWTNALLAPITSWITPHEIKCYDKDGDGYCNWGISDIKPDTCPVDCPDEKDCDDYNPYLGSYDVNGDCTTHFDLFQGAVNYYIGFSPHSVAIDDLNGDTYSDLAVANGSNVSVLLGNGDGSFMSANNYGAGSPPYSVATGDLNEDGDLDLAVANYWSDSISVLLGNGDGSFQNAVSYGAGDMAWSVAIEDLNMNSHLDLAVANRGSNNVSVLLGNGEGDFQSAVNYNTGNSAWSVATGDLNEDGHIDLAVANRGPNNVSVLLGKGDGTFYSAMNYGVGLGPYSVAIGDLNGDGHLDLAVANDLSDNVSVLLGNGDGTFHDKVNYDAGLGPSSVAIGDLNGDGDLDLATANYGSDNVSVLLGNGDGTFYSAMNYGVGLEPYSVAIGDLNGDDALDLAVANIESGNVSILINNGLKKNPNNGNWYQRFDNIMTWHEAKAHCENLDGHLATITSLDENLFVYDMASVGSRRVWLGATDEEAEGVWKWVTDEPWAFTNWASGEPNNYENEDYLEMYGWPDGSSPEDKGLWNDLNNVGYGNLAICEWDRPQPCRADFNDDGKVDEYDLEIFSFAMGEIDCTLWPSFCDCDTDGDKDVDGADLGVLAVEFGRTDCP